MIQALREVLKRKGYIFYDGDELYKLNIIGVRNDSAEPDKFDDSLYVIYKNETRDFYESRFTITTDPGLYYLKNPVNVEGTAILLEGQYEDTFRLDLHRGKYLALCQRKPVSVIRDHNRDSELDFDCEKIETGLFGINIHKAGDDSRQVGKWSAGCQVFQREKDFNKFIYLCEKHRERHGNNFTYTLINSRDLRIDAEPKGVEKVL